MKDINEQCRVVQITKAGPPSVLEFATQHLNIMEDDQVLIEQKSIGLNYLDIFYRNGTIPLPSFPSPIGLEASGIIIAKGDLVENFELGDRVAYHASLGAYADRKLVNVKDIFKMPDDVSFDVAAAFLVKGLTAYMLVNYAHPIKKGDVVLIHAVSGGVGSLLSRWAKSLGATVIGTVGSSAKKQVAINNKVDYVIALDSQDFVTEIMTFTKGKGINVVYDSVGLTTFNKSTELLINGGTAVLFGWSSGMPVIDEEMLNNKGIKYVSASLNKYLPTIESQEKVVAELFEVFLAGIFGEINPTIYALADVVQAHTDMEARKTTGMIVFHP